MSSVTPLTEIEMLFLSNEAEITILSARNTTEPGL